MNDDDRLYGGTGKNQLQGGEGNDTIYGGGDADKAYGGGGNDTIWSSWGDDLLNGGDGADHLYGGTGNDELRGGADNDQLFGGAGNDTLQGDAGVDLHIDGTGLDKITDWDPSADSFVFVSDGELDELHGLRGGGKLYFEDISQLNAERSGIDLTIKIEGVAEVVLKNFHGANTKQDLLDMGLLFEHSALSPAVQDLF